MDPLLLDIICERLRPVLFTAGLTVVRAGEPVRSLLFLVRGHLRNVHTVGGRPSSAILGPGNFTGEELLTWGLGRTADQHRLPPSTARSAQRAQEIRAGGLFHPERHSETDSQQGLVIRSVLNGRSVSRTQRRYKASGKQ